LPLIGLFFAFAVTGFGVRSGRLEEQACLLGLSLNDLGGLQSGLFLGKIGITMGLFAKTEFRYAGLLSQLYGALTRVKS